MTDEELVRKTLKGDAGAQRLLFDKFAPRMMTVCRRYLPRRQEAEDVLQEAFIRVFANLHQFRFQGSIEGWIRKTVVRLAINHLNRSNLTFEQIEDSNMVDAADIVSELSAEELLGVIQQLPPGYRTIFNLYVMEGYSHDEIAGLLGIEAVTSRTQLLRARKILQQQIIDIMKVQRYER